MLKSTLLIFTFVFSTYCSVAQLSNAQQIEAAAQWRFDRLKDEHGNFNPGYIAGALQQADNLKSVSRSNGLGLQWQELGPNNVGGYMTCLIIDKRDSTNKTLYAGSFGGGVWKSTDGAETWQSLTGWNKWLAISCITQAPAPAYSIYIGTGQGLDYPDGSSYNSGSYGNGIFKLDASDNPLLITPNVFIGNLYNPSSSLPWYGVNDISVNPFNAMQIIAATRAGLYQSADGGNNWSQVSLTGTLAAYMDLPFQTVKWSTNGQNLIAAAGYSTGSTNLIYSNNGGVNWKIESAATNPGYPATSAGRVSLAFAPSNSSMVYALMASTNNCTKGLYRSADNGNTWDSLFTGGDVFQTNPVYEDCQGSYDNVMAVSPTNPNFTYLGGVGFWTFSDSSGLTSASISSETSSNPYYITPDIKGITIAANNANQMYVVSDGGVFKSLDAINDYPNPSYHEMNQGLGITLNYGIGAGINGDVIGGGQSGTFYINPWGSQPKAGLTLLAYASIVNAVSQIDTNAWFGGTYYGGLLRSIDHCASFSDMFDVKVDPQGQGGFTICGYNVTADAQFITPFYLGETKAATNGIRKVPFVANQNYSSGSIVVVQSLTANHPFEVTLSQNLNAGDTVMIDDPIRSRLFMSSDCGVFLTSDAVNSTGVPKWFKLSNAINGSAESYVTTADDNALYCGTATGYVYHFSNLNAHADTALYLSGDSVTTLYPANFSDILVSNVANGRSIEGIDVDPADNNHVVAVVAGFSSNESQSHVYESHDGGSTWVPDTTGLPNMPVYSVVIHDSHTIIIGTEFGIWSWDGSSWHEDNGNFERVPVYRMIERPLFKDGCNVLYVASQGRGMWRCTTLTPSNCATTIPTALNNIAVNAISALSIYPNPSSNVFNVALNLQNNSAVILTVTDLTGRVVGPELSANAVAGKNLFEMDGSDLENGIYILSVSVANEQRINRSFVIAK